MVDKQMDRLKPAIHPTYSRVLCAHLKQEGFSDADIFPVPGWPGKSCSVSIAI